MKKIKKLAKPLALFIIIQLAMLSTSVFFAGGGHGTGIPLIIFYGPLLLLLKFGIFENSPGLSFMALFFILFGLFFAVLLNFVNRKILLCIAGSYILISAGMLIYTEFNHLALGSYRVSLNIRIISALIAIIINTLFWKIIFYSFNAISRKAS